MLNPFFDIIERLQQEIDALKVDIDRVQRIHSFLLNANEPDKQIIQEQRNELDRLNRQITTSSIAIKNKVRELGENKFCGQVIVKAQNATEQRMRDTQLSFLQKWFVDLMTNHSISQSEYNDKHKRLLRTQMEVIGIRKTDEEFDHMLAEPFSDVFTDGLLQKTADARQALAEVTARHEIIIQLEKSIQEVHELFVQMASMVEAQGEMVDVIERNVGRAAEATKSGGVQLGEARVKQSSARKKKIICYIILAVAVVILVVSLVSGVI